ncbi:deoxyribodipyrimidine photo-lyase [Psychromonas sp. KJ10-2]|uniref:deoxyribodipyrimidine photo-lyase n=1 Tax=Psychromonas sp. KJ10-2 TaxID=3391822 RepID=UPI0039B3ED54
MNQLLWFRNDLRTNDNPALTHFINHSTPKKTAKAVFFISEKQWLAHDWAPIKIDFIKRHAVALVEELASINVQLELVEVDGFTAQVAYLKKYCTDHDVQQVVANSELEVNEQQRDQSCLKEQIPLILFEADVIVPKGKVVTKSGEMYKVFTPFKRAWLTYVREHGYQYLPGLTNSSTTVEKPIEASLSSKWPLVSELTEKALPLFYRLKVSNYKNVRDIPSVKGTSGISPYLAAGVLSPRYVFKTLLDKYPDILTSSDSQEFCWLNEIIWREFYRHLVFAKPSLCKHKCFNDKYQQVSWPYDHTLFTAWCEGKTGYPLVDAAMRQLNQTGWMHNRLRMVVASFLTKHLLIDWRVGERYFMQHLIDGDLASNNGGWQWASSTGCDAQPYFRIFNPITQSERFDPKGTFIRKYLPELSNLPDKQIHFPHKYIKENHLSIYWPAIVDHKEARLNALAFYK